MRVAIATVEELPLGTLKKVLVQGLADTLVVGNADGVYFAMRDECNHGEADLSEGELVGFEIVCPLHSGCFDVRTGKATKRPAKRPQRVYPVEVADGTVFVDFGFDPPSESATDLATSA